MKTPIAAAAVLAACTHGLAEPLPAPGLVLPEPSLALSVQDGVEAQAAPDEPAPEAPRSSGRFGDAGSTWLTFGGGAAFAFEGDDRDYNLFGAYSIFLVDSLEFSVELGGWYFDQEGTDTGGINGSMIFRWHFWMSENRDWTVYGDAGIGLLAGFDEVPDEGTSFNFTPRAGAGLTRALDDAGTRLMLGLRWHHISNGRINSDAGNPSRDSIMIYAGIIIPF